MSSLSGRPVAKAMAFLLPFAWGPVKNTGPGFTFRHSAALDEKQNKVIYFPLLNRPYLFY